MKPQDLDVLAPGLDVMFCGLNPGLTSALQGHNFSNGSNRFWRVLKEAGFTDVVLRPHEERRLLDYGCGLTTVVRRPSRVASEISIEEFRAAHNELEAKIRRYAPRAIAFLGKRALSILSGERSVAWGPFPKPFAQVAVWVLPNPSGLNRYFTLSALARAYSELRTAIPKTTK